MPAVLVQSLGNSATQGTNVVTFSHPITAAVTAGNMVAIQYTHHGAGPTGGITITDGTANVYNIDVSLTNGTAFTTYTISCLATVALASGTNISITHGGSSARAAAIVVSEWTNINASSRLDQFNMASGSGTAVSVATTQATDTAEELVLGGVATTGSYAYTKHADYTLLGEVSSLTTIRAAIQQYLLANATGIQTASGSFAATETWSATIATYRATAGGLTTQVTSAHASTWNVAAPIVITPVTSSRTATWNIASNISYATNLLAYYTLDEPGGVRADSSSKNNYLNPVGSVFNTTGKKGSAATNFSNLNYLVSSAATLNASQNWTIAFWANATSFSGNSGYPLVMGETGGDNRWFLYYEQSTSRYIFETQPTGNGLKYNVVITYSNANVNTWHFIVMTYTAATRTKSISINNGTPVTGTHPVAADNSGNTTIIGDRWGGHLDEIGIWQRVLSSAEITYLYNGGAGRTYIDLVPYVQPVPALTASLSGSDIVWTWTYNGAAENFILQVDDNNAFTSPDQYALPATTFQYTSTGLTGGQPYYGRVRAVIPQAPPSVVNWAVVNVASVGSASYAGVGYEKVDSVKAG